jgi:hypothetical protein
LIRRVRRASASDFRFPIRKAFATKVDYQVSEVMRRRGKHLSLISMHLDAAMPRAFSFARQLAENTHLSVGAEIVRIAEHPLDAKVRCLSLGNRAPLEM